MEKHAYGHIKQGLQPRSKYRLLILAGVFGVFCLWACAVFFWASCEIGSLFSYHPGLGRPVSLFGFVGYSPVTMLGWPSYIYDYEQVESTILIAQGVLVLVPIITGVVIVELCRRGESYQDLHGTAHWASRKEIEAMGYFGGEGVYVGGWWDPRKRLLMYLRENGPVHILCFAPTRSGKGVGLILPTLLAWEHSSVVLDIKGENFAYTSGWLASQGHRVLRFDPSDTTQTSTRYNPLAEIRLETEHCIADIQQVANMVMDPDGRGADDYWNKAAIGFFPGVVLYCILKKLEKEGTRASLADVSYALEDPARENGPADLFREMVSGELIGRNPDGTERRKTTYDVARELFPNLDDGLARQMEAFCSKSAAGMLAKADKEMAGVISTATANLSLYGDPVVARNIGSSDFTIQDLMNSEQPVNLYLVISPADIDRLRPLLRIFVSQLLGRVTEKMEFSSGQTKQQYRHRLLLMFDEFTSLGKLSIVERAIAYMAGYGVKGYFIVQDTKQLNGTYGQDNALMANCHVRIAYAPNLPETAEYLSKLAGTTTVVQKKISRSSGKGGGSRSVNEQETARPLLTPDECLRLPGIHKVSVGKETVIESGDMLIFTAGNPPIYGKQILHFQDPIFLSRSKMEPVKDTQRKQRRPIPVQTQETEEIPTEVFNRAFERHLSDLPEDISK